MKREIVPSVWATSAPAGLAADPAAAEARNGWLCAGIWLTVRVISSAPPVSARMKPFPWWIGILPR